MRRRDRLVSFLQNGHFFNMASGPLELSVGFFRRFSMMNMAAKYHPNGTSKIARPCKNKIDPIKTARELPNPNVIHFRFAGVVSSRVAFSARQSAMNRDRDNSWISPGCDFSSTLQQM